MVTPQPGERRVQLEGLFAEEEPHVPAKGLNRAVHCNPIPLKLALKQQQGQRQFAEPTLEVVP